MTMDDETRDRLEYGKHQARRNKGGFSFLHDSPPRSKTSMSEGEAESFRIALAQAFREFRPSAWKVPLAVSISVTVNEKNPPHIHTIPKNYLDLCRNIIYEDDGQIEYLAVEYHPGRSFGHPLAFEFYPMSGLRQDLRLGRDIILDAWDDENEDILKVAGESSRYDFMQDPVEDWQEARRNQARIEARMGKDVAESHLRLQQYFAQEHLLRRTAIGIWKAYSIIVRPPKERAGDSALRADSRRSQFEQHKNLAKMELKSKIKMQVLNVPMKGAYSGVQFKNDLRAQVRAFKIGNPLFSKFLLPIGLQVLFAPPRGDAGVVRDIDNVMRTVAPLIHEELSPPLSMMHPADLSKVPPNIRENYERRFAEYPKGLKHQILNYEIFRVPLDRATEEAGQIAVGLCAGTSKRNLLKTTREAIETWWENRDE